MLRILRSGTSSQCYIFAVIHLRSAPVDRATFQWYIFAVLRSGASSQWYIFAVLQWTEPLSSGTSSQCSDRATFSSTSSQCSVPPSFLFLFQTSFLFLFLSDFFSFSFFSFSVLSYMGLGWPPYSLHSLLCLGLG